MYFIQLTISGVVTGFIYGLVAIGFILIFKASKILNFAQGSMLLFFGYVSWSLMAQMHIPLFWAIVSTFAIAFILGFSIERFVLRPLLGEPLLAMMAATIGLGVLIEGFTTIIWASNLKTYPVQIIPRGIVDIGGIKLGLNYIIILLVVLIIGIALFFFFKYTRIGLAMRAVAEDHEIAQSKGIKINSIFAATWIVSGLVTAFAALILGTTTGISYTLAGLGMKVFPVALLGGLESLFGAIIAGILVGILENYADLWISPLVGGGVKEIFPYVILIVVLIVSPYGLFGLRKIERI
jgi:branched-chain amino acid transport system permease protein